MYPIMCSNKNEKFYFTTNTLHIEAALFALENKSGTIIYFSLLFDEI